MFFLGRISTEGCFLKNAYMSGWIKLHRSILKHWIFSDPAYLKAWVTILMEVNHEDKKVLIDSELYECKRGQAVKSLGSWVKRFGRGWSMQKIRTFFFLLRNDGMINTRATNKTTILTVCNYSKYQDQ